MQCFEEVNSCLVEENEKIQVETNIRILIDVAVTRESAEFIE